MVRFASMQKNASALHLILKPMCEHARSTGATNLFRSPSSGNASAQFPSVVFQQLDDASKTAPPTAQAAGFYRRVYPSIRNLFLHLQTSLAGAALPHPPEKVASVSDLLQAVSVADGEWQDFVRFDGKKYTRNLIAHDASFTVLLLCWNSSQCSPIHDHAGSSCWVKVLKGRLRERRFAMPGGSAFTGGAAQEAALEQISDVTLGAGEVCYINDSQGVHDMGNPSADEGTVTLHVYSPPYYNCSAFNELSGARRSVSMLAAAAPTREVLGPDDAEDDGPVPDARALAPTGAHAEVSKAVATSDGGCSGALAVRTRSDPTPAADALSLTQFIKVLDQPRSADADVVAAFTKLHLGKPEWSSYVHFSDFRFQRMLLHSNHRYSLLMLCWLPGQQTPPHDHQGSKSWVRVISGELVYHEVDQAGGVVPSTVTKLTRCAASPFVEDDTLAMHVVGNQSSTYAVSLHLYSPPYTDLTYTDVGCGSHDSEQSHNENGTATTTPAATVCHHRVIPYAVCSRKLDVAAAAGGDAGAQAAAAANARTRMLSGFYVLTERLAMAMSSRTATLPELSVNVLELLEEQVFSPYELEQYWQLRERIDYRVRLHDSETFCVSLNLWNPEHESVIHDHDGSLAWVKVLDGALMDTVFEESQDGGCLEEANSSRLITGSVAFHGSKVRHALANKSKTRRAISLHVYCARECCRSASDSAAAAAASRGALIASSPGAGGRWRELFGAQQGCRWYTRAQPRNGIRVLTVTAVEDTNWSLSSPTAQGASRRFP